jgi:hypothetical protein
MSILPSALHRPFLNLGLDFRLTEFNSASKEAMNGAAGRWGRTAPGAITESHPTSYAPKDKA